MNPVETLNLRDIHLPDSIVWWPPAIGWWMSALLLIIVMVAVTLMIRRIRMPSLSKDAKAMIAQVMSEYKSHGDQTILIQQLSIALRRIGISYLPRNEIAGLSGKDWYQQLNQLGQGETLSEDVIELLLHQPYQKNQPLDEHQIDHLQMQVQRWVSGLAAR